MSRSPRYGFDLAELERRLANVFRIGIVHELDASGPVPRASVFVRDEENVQVETDMRPIAGARAGKDRDGWLPEPGEGVLLCSPMGDLAQAIIVASLYSVTNPCPVNAAGVWRKTFADGARIEYDRATHALDAVLPTGGTAMVKADKVTSDAPDTECTGDLRVKGTVTAEKGLVSNGPSSLNAGVSVKRGKSGSGGAVAQFEGDVSAKGNWKQDGNIAATGTVMDGGGNSNHHSH